PDAAVDAAPEPIPPADTPAPGTEAATPEPSAGPGADEVAAAWSDAVVPKLGGLARAMFSAGRVTDVTAGEVVLAFPNDAHRQKCERKKPEVERVLSDHLGRPYRLRLVADDNVAGPADAPARDRVPEPEPEPLGSDVHELEDAPPAPVVGVDALTAAFPGAELIEHDE
ncbi:MAG: polymerase subunit gamma/tau, partial [Acidimicrobiales bacterium]|nr:polymerase subunit gamma/tau [Acidimicrobiales bacterium]